MKSVLTAVLAFTFSVMPLSSDADSSIEVVYGDAYKPFAWVEDGVVQGIQVDFVQTILVDKMGLSVKHAGCPWKRCQREVRKGNKDAFFTVPTAERAEYTDKTLFPFYVTQFVMHTSRQNQFLNRLAKVKSLEELASIKDLRHIHMLGSGWHEATLINMKRVQTSKDADTIPLLLARSRADVYIEQAEMFRYQARELGLEDDLVSFEHFPIDALGWHLFIAKSSEHRDLLARIDFVLAEMVSSGELAELKNRIFAKYGLN